MRIIAVTSGKGGVGKTTIALNLAVTLIQYFGKKVTLIDANVTTSHLPLHLGLFNYAKSLNDALRGDANLLEAAVMHESGVQVIPASMNLSDLVGVDVLMLKKRIEEDLLIEDFVLIDTAPGFGKEALAALKACKEALIVSTPDLPAITDVMRAKRILEELGVKDVYLVLNMVRGKKFELKRSEIARITELPILAEIPYDERFLSCLAMKKPYVTEVSYSRAKLQFLEMASMLTKEPYELPKISLLRRLLNFFGGK